VQDGEATFMFISLLMRTEQAMGNSATFLTNTQWRNLNRRNQELNTTFVGSMRADHNKSNKRIQKM